MARIIEGEQTNLVGKNVRRLRNARHMSQYALSEKLESMGIFVCRGSISRIEDQTRTVTDMELYGLAKALNVSIDALFPDFAVEF